MKTFTSFSLIKNCKKLISIDENPEDIAVIHGIRFVNFLLIYVGHKALSEMFGPTVNRTSITKVMYTSFGNNFEKCLKYYFFEQIVIYFQQLFAIRSIVIMKSLPLYTDSFLLMSGTLTSYYLGKQILENKRISIMKEYISRFIR